MLRVTWAQWPAVRAKLASAAGKLAAQGGEVFLEDGGHGAGPAMAVIATMGGRA